MRSMKTLALCLMLACVVPAQDTRGKIFGTVTDSQGAMVLGAAGTVANTGAGTSTRLTTNASGYYEAPLLLPGTYSVTVEMSGFKRIVRSGLTLGMSDQLQINLQLEVGGVTESV